MEKIKQVYVKMTKAEKENYYNLTDEEKKAFDKKIIANKQRKTFLSVVLAQLMLENIDSLENYGLINKNLKISARQYKIQINNFLNKVFKNKNIKNENIDVLTLISSDIEKLIGDHYDLIHSKINKNN